jgi:hypothetical protein
LTNLEQLVLSVITKAQATGIGITDTDVISTINVVGRGMSFGAYPLYSTAVIAAALDGLRRQGILDNNGSNGSLRVSNSLYQEVWGDRNSGI